MQTMFINKLIWTDVNSYKVFDIQGNHAKAIRVKKNPNMDYMTFIPGGFVGHYPEQHDAYRFSNDIVEEGEAFDIECRKGIWGHWRYDGFVFFGITAEGVERQMAHSAKVGNLCEAYQDEDGTFTIRIFFLTKTGKKKRTFHKLGVLEEECRYFYDHNF